MTHQLMVGEYHLEFDPPALPIPEEWRSRFDDGAVVDVLESHLRLRPAPAPLGDLLVHLTGGALSLPREIVDSLDLTEEVVLVGVINSIEVWDPATWTARVEEAERAASEGALGGWLSDNNS